MRRGYSYGRPAVETSYEKQVLALSRACAEFGLAAEEVLAMPPARYNSCHGNSYAVWNKAQLSEARAQKRQQEERRQEEAHGGAAGLAAHRAKLAAAEAHHAAASKVRTLRESIAELQPGRTLPACLPSFCASKAAAKRAYFLTDKDLKSVNYQDGEMLLKAAQKKHGALGFNQKRQAAADDEVAPRRLSLEAELCALESKYPDLKISARKAAEVDAARLEAEAREAEVKAAAAAATAKVLRTKANAARGKAQRLASEEGGGGSGASSSSAPVAATASGKRKAPELGAASDGESPAVPSKLAPIFMMQKQTAA